MRIIKYLLLLFFMQISLNSFAASHKEVMDLIKNLDLEKVHNRALVKDAEKLTQDLLVKKHIKSEMERVILKNTIINNFSWQVRKGLFYRNYKNSISSEKIKNIKNNLNELESINLDITKNFNYELEGLIEYHISK